MRSLLRIAIVAAFVCFFVSVRPAEACDNQYQVTIRYYNANQQPVGWETYYCNGAYISHGTLSGPWMEETDTNCCTGQSQTSYFYFCPDGIPHGVAYIGDTNCS